MTSIGFQNLFRVPQQESDVNYEKLQTFLFLTFQYPARIAIEIWASPWLLDVSARWKSYLRFHPQNSSVYMRFIVELSLSHTHSQISQMCLVLKKMFLELVQIASNSRLRTLATAWYISCIGPDRFWSDSWIRSN